MPAEERRRAAGARRVAAAGGHATLVRAPAACAPPSRCSSRRRRVACRLSKRVQGELRPQGRAQSRPDVGGCVGHADLLLAHPVRRSACRGSRKKSCAPACIAASAPPPARPMCCSATNSIRPRGRIYLIKDMLENSRPASREVVKHIDRCLSCLACMTTCPSGVHYMHLVDHAREHIETDLQAPACRPRRSATLLARVLPDPAKFRLAVVAGLLASRSPRLLEAHRPQAHGGDAAVDAAPRRAAGRAHRQVFPALGQRRGRVALLSGCINRCSRRNRRGRRSVCSTRTASRSSSPRGEGCCGSLIHHMGREADALNFARATISTPGRARSRRAGSTPS